MIRGVRLALLGAILAMVGMLVPAPPAAAHAYIVSVDPANGSQLDQPPTRISVTFSEPVTLAAEVATSVLNSRGERVDNGRVDMLDDRRTLVIGVREGLPEDRYIASWTVVSADSHPVGGSVQFGYGVPALPLPNPTAQPSPALGLALALVKGVLYLGLLPAVGTVPAAALLGLGAAGFARVRALARWGTGLAVIASVAQVIVQYAWDASGSPAGPTGAGLLAFLTTPYALTVLVRIVLLAGAALASPPGPASRGRLAATVLLGIGALVATVRTGHGGAGPWWLSASTVLHVTAAVAWLGGLIVLLLVGLRSTEPATQRPADPATRRHAEPATQRPAEPAAQRPADAGVLRRLPRWSLYAGSAVTVIAATGLVQAVVRVRYPAALFSTSYGVVLLAKVVLVAAALGLGAQGYRWMRRHVRGRSDDPGAVVLRRRIRLEAAVGALVVVLSGLLSTVVPASAAYAPTRVLGEEVGPYTVSITVGPARLGPQTFRITVVGDHPETPIARSLQLDLARADGTVRGLSVDFPYRLPGAIGADTATPFTFVSAATSIPDTGAWTGTLTVVAGEKLQYTTQFTYHVV